MESILSNHFREAQVTSAEGDWRLRAKRSTQRFLITREVVVDLHGARRCSGAECVHQAAPGPAAASAGSRR